MAVISATPIFSERNDIIAFEWVGVTESDTMAVAEAHTRSDATVQVSGTFGGATITIQGSIDPASTVMSTLNDPQGTPITFATDGISAVMENVAFIQPIITGGVSTSLTIRLYAR